MIAYVVGELWAFGDALAQQWALATGGSLAIWLLAWGLGAAVRRLRSTEWEISQTGRGLLVLVFLAGLAWHSERVKNVAMEEARPYFNADEFHFQEERVGNAPLKTNKVIRMKWLNSSTARPARNIVIELVVMRDDFSQPAVTIATDESVNDIGPGGDLAIGSTNLRFGPNDPPLYVYSHLSYNDAFTGKLHHQVFYNKWTGYQPGGIFVGTLFNVDRFERAQMEKFVIEVLGRPLPVTTP
jgi:hypothetical protein